MNEEIKEMTEKYLRENPDEYDKIKRSLMIHQARLKEHPDDILYKYFGWDDVRIHGSVLKKWIIAGFLKFGYKSSKSKKYEFVDIEATEQALDEFKEAQEIKKQPQEQKQMEISDDLFDPIFELDDIKRMLVMALKSKKQTHVCFYGPPATAKSMFLLQVSKLPDSYYVVGSSATKVGLTEVLMQNQPKILLIDEIDKLAKHSEELSVLLSLMETGLVKSTKHGKHESVVLNTKVIAAGNVRNLPRELSSRFLEFHLNEYSEVEFKKILIHYLIQAEDIDEEIAEYVAEKIYRLSNDVRTARNIIRMAETKEDIDTMIKMLKKYGDLNGSK